MNPYVRTTEVFAVISDSIMRYAERSSAWNNPEGEKRWIKMC